MPEKLIVYLKMSALLHYPNTNNAKKTENFYENEKKEEKKLIDKIFFSRTDLPYFSTNFSLIFYMFNFFAFFINNNILVDATHKNTHTHRHYCLHTMSLPKRFMAKMRSVLHHRRYKYQYPAKKATALKMATIT